jgi:hypothetical protein
MRTKVKVGDIKRVPNKYGNGDFIVEIKEIIEDNGVQYALCKPVDFEGAERLIETYKLFNV